MVYNSKHTLGDYFTSSRKKGMNGLRILSVTMNGGLVERGTLERRTETSLKPSEHLRVQEGDIAYNMMRMWQGAFGRASKGGLISPAYVVMRPKDGTDSRFAAQLFKTSRLIHLFWAYSYGLTKDRLRLYPQDFLNIPFDFPDKLVQTKVADVLETWDKAIATTERLLANSENQKKALMQQLLTGKKRLPGFSGKWKSVALNDVAAVTMGSSPKSEAYNQNQEGIPLIQGNADIKGRRSVPKNYTTEVTKECRIGDILLSVRAPVGAVSISAHRACIGRGIAAIRAREGASQEFLFQELLLREPRWAALSQGSTFESINGKEVRQLHLTVPGLSEQKAIVDVLTTADHEVDVLAKKLELLKQEKKALMQQLLTGKRRVKVA